MARLPPKIKRKIADAHETHMRELRESFNNGPLWRLLTNLSFDKLKQAEVWLARDLAIKEIGPIILVKGKGGAAEPVSTAHLAQEIASDFLRYSGSNRGAEPLTRKWGKYQKLRKAFIMSLKKVVDERNAYAARQ